MDVLMPQLGETVAEGKITKWFKSAGDSVKPGENLFEIETDKTSMEVPSTVTGTLTAINVQVGDVAKVGAVVAVIGDAGQTAPAGHSAAAPPVAAALPVASNLAPAAASFVPRPADSSRSAPFISPPRVNGSSATMHPFREVQTPERNYGPGRIGGREVTPLARRLAGERGIDLSRVSGSGPYGRIVARDLENVSPARATLDGGPTAAQIKAMFEGVVYEEVRLEAARVTRARRLVEAQQTIPHFYLTADVEIGRVLAFCDEANLSAPGSGGEPAFMLSPGDFIVKMWGAALQRVPEANAAWAEDRALRFRSSDIAVAIALGGGVVTPVLHDVETKSVSIISAELKALASDRAPETSEYPSSATALYNLGTDGVRELSAIINPPQTTVLAIGAPRRVPVEREDGSVRFVSQMTATLTCDHRVIDAALGARLLTAFKSFVENPVTALV